MQNPILQMLSGNNQMNNIIGLISSLKNGNPNQMFNQMINDNPQFAQFVKDNQYKSVNQIAKDYGVDINLLQQFIK